MLADRSTMLCHGGKTNTMLDFTYYTPTKVVFGRNAENKTGGLIKEHNATKVLIIYGSERVRKTGLLDTIEAQLDSLGITYIELGGVVPNPRLSLVEKGIDLCRHENVDFILAVGGGSVIDSAKAIGYGAADPDAGKVWDFYCKTRTPVKTVPVGVILTISATGSEMSNSSVITNEDGWIKCGCNNDISRPKFAIMDPKLTETLPEYQTECGCADIMMHTLERYLSASGNMEITDSISEALLRTVMKYALILKREPHNYEARAEVMWAGSLSHNGLTGCGTDGGDWACHKLEHELGGMYDVAHGAGLTALWGTWAKYVYKNKPDRFARLAVNVLGVTPGKNDEDTALSGISAMEDFFRSINMPVSLTELGIVPTDDEYVELARKCSLTANDNLGSIMNLHRADMEAIYRMAL